jgi:hypothetical protein
MLKRLLEVVSDLEEFEMIETSLRFFGSSSSYFHLSPEVGEGFRLSESKESGIFEIGEPEIEFRTRKEVHSFLNEPGISPPMFLNP